VAPKRIEFFPTTDPDAYAEDGLNSFLSMNTAIPPINKMNRGFTRVLYYILEIRPQAEYWEPLSPPGSSKEMQPLRNGFNKYRKGPHWQA